MIINYTHTYYKLKDKPKNNFVEYLVIHHSGGTDSNPLADTSNHTAKMMEAWHLQKGWEGLGYHYVIHKDGSLWAGRPEHRNGAHVKEVGINTRSLGICLAGNFDASMPTQQQIDTLKSLVVAKMASYSVPLEKVVPHRHFLGNPPYKACYGSKLSDNWIKELVKNSLTIDNTGNKVKVNELCSIEKEEIKSLKKLINDLYVYIKKLLGV